MTDRRAITAGFSPDESGGLGKLAAPVWIA